MEPRELIRARVIARLLNNTAAGAEVHDSRPYNVWPDKMPAIHVFTPRDDLSLHRQSPRVSKATCTVELVLFVRTRMVGAPPALVPASKGLDDLIGQVMSWLETDRLLRDPLTKEAAAADGPENGLCVSIETDFDDGNRSVIAGAKLSWRYLYTRTAADTPIPPAEDLDLLHVEWELQGNNAVPEAVDDVPMPG